MKNLLIILSALAVTLLLTSVAFAGESKTIGVSCTIPAIPGVNAPPFPEVKKTINLQEPQAQANTEKEAEKSQSTQDSTSIIVAQDKKDPGLQTIYSR